jgi:hypothetical protein
MSVRIWRTEPERRQTPEKQKNIPVDVFTEKEGDFDL